jgi:hypothetical protein
LVGHGTEAIWLAKATPDELKDAHLLNAHIGLSALAPVDLASTWVCG